MLGGVEPGHLDAEMRLFVADFLARHSRREDAARRIYGRGQPPLSDAMSLQGLWHAELERYRLVRVLRERSKVETPARSAKVANVCSRS